MLLAQRLTSPKQPSSPNSRSPEYNFSQGQSPSGYAGGQKASGYDLSQSIPITEIVQQASVMGQHPQVSQFQPGANGTVVPPQHISFGQQYLQQQQQEEQQLYYPN